VYYERALQSLRGQFILIVIVTAESLALKRRGWTLKSFVFPCWGLGWLLVGELSSPDVPGGGNPQQHYPPAATLSLLGRRGKSNTRTIRVRLLLSKSQARILEGLPIIVLNSGMRLTLRGGGYSTRAG